MALKRWSPVLLLVSLLMALAALAAACGGQAAPTPTPTPTEVPKVEPQVDVKALQLGKANPLDESTKDPTRAGGSTFYIVQLQAARGQWVSADSDNKIRANRNQPQMWETFLLFDFNGGNLMHDDWVVLIAHNGFFQAVWPRNFGYTAWTPTFFKIHRCCGRTGQITNNDKIDLWVGGTWWYQDPRGDWKWGNPYMVAGDAGGGVVDFNRGAPYPGETWDWMIFTIRNVGGATASPAIAQAGQNLGLVGPFQKGANIIQQSTGFTMPIGNNLNNATPLTATTP